MVGRLVEHQQIRWEKQHFCQRETCFLTTREHFHLLVDCLAAEEERPEQRLDFDAHVACSHVVQSLEYRLLRVEHILLVLSVVADFHLMAELHLAGMVEHAADYLRKG